MHGARTEFQQKKMRTKTKENSLNIFEAIVVKNVSHKKSSKRK